MVQLKNGLTIRGDSYYCPLSFSLDTYWNCETNCSNCYLRRLNRTWGSDLRPLDVEIFKKKILSGLKNSSPKSAVGFAIRNKKTIRLGNKTDPFQMANNKYRITESILKFLISLQWDIVIQSKFTSNMCESEKDWTIETINIMPIISCGLEKDWEIFEYKKTTNPLDRIKFISKKQKEGFNVGVNGEPFIGGYHTIKDMEITLKLLKEYGIKSYNTYNLHLNDWNAKKMYESGVDIEKVWFENKDENWKKNLIKILDLSKKYDIIMGCPDFINSGDYTEPVNTCCGLNVKNPCTFNMIHWKKLKQKGLSNSEIIDLTWDGVGDKNTGENLLTGKNSDFYNLKDIDGDLF